MTAGATQELRIVSPGDSYDRRIHSPTMAPTSTAALARTTARRGYGAADSRCSALRAQPPATRRTARPFVATAVAHLREKAHVHRVGCCYAAVDAVVRRRLRATSTRLSPFGTSSSNGALRHHAVLVPLGLHRVVDLPVWDGQPRADSTCGGAATSSGVSGASAGDRAVADDKALAARGRTPVAHISRSTFACHDGVRPLLDELDPQDVSVWLTIGG